jgi:S1-C subfamily serine protease
MRLLLATVAVSVAMLLLLARYRFPEEAARQTVESAPAPLERLAARATFDELASIMADLERRILPSIVTVAGLSASGTLYVPAVRLASDRAVALLSGERHVGPISGTEPPVIVFRDAARDLVVLQTPTVTDAVPPLPATASRPGPRYIAVVESSGAGHAVRPVYIGRTDLFTDPRWSDSLLGVAAVQQTVSPGSAVFSLDGTFIGLATESAGRLMIVPAQTLRGIVSGAPPAPAVRADLPLEVQPLSPSLSRASGADRGVMVSYVRDPKAEVAAGDVIQTIDGIDVTTVGGYQLVAQSRKPGATVTLALVRRGEPLTVSVTAAEAGSATVSTPQNDPGAVLRSVPGIGTEVVAVEPGSAAARAGVRRGDLIVRVDATLAPDAGSIAKMFGAAKPTTFLLLTIRREGQHQVVALEKR